jgi:hypothetical protein
MTLGARTTALGILLLASACSIQRDVPGFAAPPSTLSATDAAKPTLQPTETLIVDASGDEEAYRRLIAEIEGRTADLRQSVAGAPDQ